MAAAITASAGETIACQNCPGHPRLILNHHLVTAQTLQVDKLVTVTASRDAVAESADVTGRALSTLRNHSYEQLRTAQQNAWGNLWQDCDIIIEGDEEAQLAVRFNLFQLLVAAPQTDDRVSIGGEDTEWSWVSRPCVLGYRDFLSCRS